MYLVRIDKKSGLVDIGDTKDGVLAIPAFKALIDNPEFGLLAFTCVALTIDYESPIQNYDYLERHKKAMRNVTGNSKAFPWAHELIQNALAAYSDIQYIPDLEELEELRKMRNKKFKQVREEEDEKQKIAYLTELQKLKKLEKEFERGIDRAALLEDAPTRGDYTLSRLEQLVTNKTSHYHERGNAKQPGKPGGNKPSGNKSTGGSNKSSRQTARSRRRSKSKS